MYLLSLYQFTVTNQLYIILNYNISLWNILCTFMIFRASHYFFCCLIVKSIEFLLFLYVLLISFIFIISFWSYYISLINQSSQSFHSLFVYILYTYKVKLYIVSDKHQNNFLFSFSFASVSTFGSVSAQVQRIYSYLNIVLS